ncbi:hypothetical protein EV382_0338 [Micromonospora violae]|uniref:GIY-YIG catalytic domain-containing protein n=1 Tax=Micromonospora violae TaxID=1278207 RepID=A0A4Q7U8H8_9ACTN|nr:hypothetical protein EV382_0338 [Micromonospora violae]
MSSHRIDLTTTLLPREVQAIRDAISTALRQPDPQRPGQTIGKAKAGIYAFYDYDEEPIYVGQTAEGFGVRLGRHLTGQRSDAVAKYVLDPFEVHTRRDVVAASHWRSTLEIPEIRSRPLRVRRIPEAAQGERIQRHPKRR